MNSSLHGVSNRFLEKNYPFNILSGQMGADFHAGPDLEKIVNHCQVCNRPSFAAVTETA